MKQLCLLISTMILVLFVSGCESKKEERDLQVMAYYVPSSSVDVNQLPYQELTHVIFSFTHVIDHEMKFASEGLSEKLEALVNASKEHPHIKVMIACGGWGGSGGFSDMVFTAENRKVFVNSVIQFIDKYGLDGLDLDWEYPGLPGIGNTFRPEDKENFTALTKELRTAMDAYKPGLILTFASAGWELYYKHVELDQVMKNVDYMNIMTYDMAGNIPLTNHHTPLYGTPVSELDTIVTQALNEKNRVYQQRSANDIIGFCIEQGVNPNQIVIGAAFYGRSWKGVNPEKNGLRQHHNNVKSATSYTKLKSMMAADTNYKRFWDSTAKAPYIFNKKDSIFFSFDDPESIALKTQYALDEKLGGIMFWQLSHDHPDYDLVGAIDKVKHKAASSDE